MSLGEDPKAASAAFGKRLRTLREKRGLSLEDLAEKTGVHWTAISRLERGKREPRLATVLRLAEGLGVEPGKLVDRLDR